MTQTIRQYQRVRVAEDPQTRALTQHAIERFTGIVTDTITLTNVPVDPVNVFLNGVRLDPDSTPAEYTIVDRTVTLVTPLVATDVVTVEHYYRRA